MRNISNHLARSVRAMRWGCKERLSGGSGIMVAAQEDDLQELLGGAKQYRVPLYQRTYSWKEEHRNKLWEDIVRLAEDRREHPDATHFIGSLVLALSPAASAVGVQDFLVIDG